MNATHCIFLAEIALAGDGVAPTAFRILAAGENRTRRAGVESTVVFDERAAERVLAEYRDGGVDLPIDLEHAMASPTARVDEKFAAGWFRPGVRDGELWAEDVQWTPRGKAAVESKEWRYTSLWGESEIDESKKRVRLVRLRNVALVNTPATKGTRSLVMGEGEETTMSNPIMLALGVADEAEGVKKVRDLETVFSEAAEVCGSKSTDEIRGGLRALKLRAEKATELEAKLAEAAAKAETEKRDALIVKLSEEGKLPPALHDWARTLPLPALVAFGEKAPTLVTKEPVKPATTDAVGPTWLSEAKTLSGLPEEQFAAAAKAAGVI